MQPVQKALRKALVVSLLFTLAFPVGGIMLGVGLGIGVPAVWAIGIALLGIAFYGCPCAWALSYGPTKANVRLISAITQEHLLTVRELSAQLSLSEKEVRDRLDVCFRKNWLIGYKREGDTLVLNENRAPEKRTYAAECPFCNAKFSYTAEDARCPYCGSPVQK